MLTVIVGCMFAGKSERLISLAHANEVANNKVRAYKPRRDDRYATNEIVTHAGSRYPATVLENDLSDWKFDPTVDVHIFDEAQFFDEEMLTTIVRALLYSDNSKDVVIVGLSQDSFGTPFGAMPYFLATADDIIHLRAVCTIIRKLGTATRTFRKDVSDKSQVVVGGSEIYEPRSFEEWLKGTLL